MPRIAVDAMGGDRAPLEIVQGAALAHDRGIDVVLVGDEHQLKPLLDDLANPLPVHHASQVVGMADDPAAAVRDKKDSSIAVAAGLLRSGEVDGMVSAGSTGAAMAAAAFIVGRLPGVSRPAIASVFPTGHIVIDAGANLECKPIHLVQFAVMGSAVATVYHGRTNPKVGLLNIGEEDGKGRDLEKEAHARLVAAPGVNFVGNVEGRDLGSDTADVIVTDGFTGNVLLKTSEGVVRALYRMILAALSAEEYREGLAALTPAFSEVRRNIDPESTGGAHLVGTRGVVVISHGSSTRVAIDNAIGMAADGVEQGLIDRIRDGIATLEPAPSP